MALSRLTGARTNVETETITLQFGADEVALEASAVPAVIAALSGHAFAIDRAKERGLHPLTLKSNDAAIAIAGERIVVVFTLEGGAKFPLEIPKPLLAYLRDLLAKGVEATAEPKGAH